MSPWYSGLAQGQGVSLLVRAYKETRKEVYLDCAKKAFMVFLHGLDSGGVAYRDEKGNIWLEEYIVDPPGHILNGFLWTLWGVYDYFLLTKENSAKQLWEECLKTLQENLEKFDIKYWSLYDLSKTKIKNLASPFYHKLHIVQLKVLYQLSGVETFKKYSDSWEEYQDNKFDRIRAYWHKAIFKLVYF
jgi:hypothetical protein